MGTRLGQILLVAHSLLWVVVVSLAEGQEPAIPMVPESESVQRIRAVLDKPVSDELKPAERQGPLDAIVKRISELHEIPIELDGKSLGDAGVADTVPVVMTFAKIPLKSALRLMLRPKELTTIFRDERLVITTNAAANDIALNGTTRVYAVDDLCPPITRQNRFLHNIERDTDSLVRLICASIWPTYWTEVGGAGSARIAVTNGVPVLVVSQTEEIQEIVSHLLQTLRAARACQMEPDPRYEKELGGIPVSLGESMPDSWRKQFEASHDFKPIVKIELQDLSQYFGTFSNLPLELDEKALGDAGVPLDAALHVTGGRFSLAAALQACLRPNELTWLVRDDVIRITTMSAANDISVNGEIRVYPVADLVGHEWSPVTSKQFADYDELIHLIHGTVAPTTWSDVGGQASDIQPFGGSLVINQTSSVHKEIGVLITTLRKARLANKPVTQPPAPQGLQVRVFTVSAFATQPESLPPGATKGVPLQFRGQITSGSGGSARGSRTMTQGTRVVKELVDTIPQIIAIKSWKGAGGEGTIHVVGNRIVVRQEMTVIDEIAEFLAALNEQPGYSGGGAF